jgi:hypothetical protein
MLLSLSFFLTVSFNDNPYYYGPDIVFLFAWTPFVLAGSGEWSLDAVFARRAERAHRAVLAAAARGGPAARHRAAEFERRVFLQKASAAGVIGIAGLVAGGVMAAIGRLAGGSQPSVGSKPVGRSSATASPQHDHIQRTQRGEHDDVVFGGLERHDPEGHSNRASQRRASGGRGQFHRPERGRARTRRAGQARCIQSVLSRVPARWVSSSVRPAERSLRVPLSRIDLQRLDRRGPTGSGTDRVVQYPHRPRVKRRVICRRLRRDEPPQRPLRPPQNVLLGCVALRTSLLPLNPYNVP